VMLIPELQSRFSVLPFPAQRKSWKTHNRIMPSISHN
jgi:hypothetical protein